ncbi:MAG: hypothetical protein J5995_00615, partial [Muribaculaceae bacterium]|nr:hypothetical protein [Muribaculaceae bacterium]
MKRKILTGCIAASLIALHSFMGEAAADDSIPATELKELEVVAERAWIGEDGTMNFIPTRNEKKLSNSPGS